MSHKIFIADDESHIRDTLSAYFKQEGWQVISAHDGREALSAFRASAPDIVILDVMMPEMDGWQVARLIRKESNVPLLFLTARVDDIDQITGLEIGADEYLTKPFSPRVVVARVRALLRRSYGEFTQETRTWRIAGLELNAETHLASYEGQRLDLTPSEFSLLQTFITRPGRVFTRLELLDHMQGDAYAGYERTIDVHVKNLRLKLGAGAGLIETVYGVGYRMNAHE
jgi:DNA-binding response OmpR family regulator